MNRRTQVALVVALALAAGCVPSLHPLYTDKDVVFEPKLVGQWTGDDGKETWDFRKAGDKAYTLVQTDRNGKTGKLEVHLVKLGGALFLDLYPDEPKLEASDLYKIHLVPAHTFMLVGQIGPTLKLAMMDPEWVDKRLKANPKALKHERMEDGIVLTASTTELQAFVLEHGKTGEAFGDFGELKRRKPGK